MTDQSSQTKKVPKLRFPGFTDDWQYKKLSEVADVKGGKRLPKNYQLQSEDNGYPYITVSDMANGTVEVDKIRYVPQPAYAAIKNYRISVADIYISVAGTLGLVGTVPMELDGANLTENADRLTNLKAEQPYILQFLKSRRFMKVVKSAMTAGAQPKLAIYVIQKFTITLPSVDEQRKIADFLTVVDDKISALQTKKKQLHKYKKGMAQAIFLRKLRFYGKNGDLYPEWKFQRLERISRRVISKNKDDSSTRVLTNSASRGVVKQGDYFNKDIANSDHLGGYYVVSVDDFVYNPRISDSAPVGPINRNHVGLGVMSPLYLVFNITDGNLGFYESYFHTTRWHKYIKSVANSGARHDRMNIVNADFFRMPVPCPDIEEQRKIADFLTSIDDKIELTEKELEQAKVFKKALLQQMFV